MPIGRCFALPLKGLGLGFQLRKMHESTPMYSAYTGRCEIHLVIYTDQHSCVICLHRPLCDSSS